MGAILSPNLCTLELEFDISKFLYSILFFRENYKKNHQFFYFLHFYPKLLDIFYLYNELLNFQL